MSWVLRQGWMTIVVQKYLEVVRWTRRRAPREHELMHAATTSEDAPKTMCFLIADTNITPLHCPNIPSLRSRYWPSIRLHLNVIILLSATFQTSLLCKWFKNTSLWLSICRIPWQSMMSLHISSCIRLLEILLFFVRQSLPSRLQRLIHPLYTGESTNRRAHSRRYPR